jgi:hypothetical protein
MASHSLGFPWPSHYGHFDFFERKMEQHQKVASLVVESGGVYRLVRVGGDTLRVFICECYAFGVAEYLETTSQLDQLNAIIINSAWCGYSPEAKRQCRDEGVGLFRIGEFMGALNRVDYWAYLTEWEEKYFLQQGWQ